MRWIRIGTIDFMCCWSGMALALQLLLLFYPPLLLFPNCGAGFGFPGMLDLASAGGMILGVLIGSWITQGSLQGLRWLALLGSMVAMTLFPTVGTPTAFLTAGALPGVHMAVLMIPSMLVGYGLAGVFSLIAVWRNERQRKHKERGKLQL